MTLRNIIFFSIYSCLRILAPRGPSSLQIQVSKCRCPSSPGSSWPPWLQIQALIRVHKKIQEPGGANRSHEEPRVTIGSQEEPGGSAYASRNLQLEPGGTRMTWGNVRGARRTKEEPREPRDLKRRPQTYYPHDFLGGAPGPPRLPLSTATTFDRY